MYLRAVVAPATARPITTQMTRKSASRASSWTRWVSMDVPHPIDATTVVVSLVAGGMAAATFRLRTR